MARKKKALVEHGWVGKGKDGGVLWGSKILVLYEGISFWDRNHPSLSRASSPYATGSGREIW